MIVKWSRLKRDSVGGINFGGTRDMRGPMLWFGAVAPEGTFADVANFYGAAITNDARKAGQWGWANTRPFAPLFYWPVAMRDGMRLVMAPTAHDTAVLFL